MALSVKKGTFTISSTDSGTKSVTGVGFQGTALILWVGQDSTGSWATNARLSIGMATEDDARCCSIMDQDGQGTAQVVGLLSMTDVLRAQSAAGTMVVSYSPAATLFTSDGFDLTVNDPPGVDHVVHYVVLGGDDITGAEILDLTWPASGDFPYEPTASFQPDLLFIAGSNIGEGATSVDEAGAGSTYGIHFGIAKSDTERACTFYGADDGAGTMNTASLLEDAAFAQLRSTTSPTLERVVDLDARANWPATGPRFTFVTGTGTQTGGYAFALSLAGDFEAGVGKRTSAASEDIDDITSGVTTPKLSFFFSDDLPDHAGMDTSASDGHGIGIGAFDGTTQGLVDIQQDDGNTTSVAKHISDTSNAIRLTGPGETPADNGVGVVSYPSADTVRITWTGRDATARDFGWAVIGEAEAGGAFELDSQPGSYALTGTAATPIATRLVSASPASYALTGTAATVPAGRVVSADPGSYTLTGSLATVLATRLLSSSPASYVLTGVEAELVYTPVGGAFELSADAGAYTLIGAVAGALAGRVVSASPGSYTLTGVQAGVLVGRVVSASPGSFTVTGVLMGTSSNKVISAVPGTYTLTGVSAEFVFVTDRDLIIAPITKTSLTLAEGAGGELAPGIPDPPSLTLDPTTKGTLS